MKKSDKKLKKENLKIFSAIVAEGMYRDKNLGVVPLTETIQKKLGVSKGDIVEIAFNKKKVVATAIDGYKKDSQSNYIRLDRRTRDELNVILGEEVTISKPLISNAKEVIVKTPEKIPRTIPVPIDWQTYFRQRLENKGIIEGSKINMPTLGLDIEFDVVNVLPLGVCKITKETKFNFLE